jgi:hypothetical protein
MAVLTVEQKARWRELTGKPVAGEVRFMPPPPPGGPPLGPVPPPVGFGRHPGGKGPEKWRGPR